MTGRCILVLIASGWLFTVSTIRANEEIDAWERHGSQAPPAHAGQPVPSAQAGIIPANLYSQILDAPTRPEYSFRSAVVEQGDIGNYGRSAMVEFELDWKLAFFRNILYGDLDLAARFDHRVIANSPTLSLPDVLSALALEAGMVWRDWEGYAFELRLFPGVYGDLFSPTSDGFGMPTRGLWHRAIHPRLAGVAGVEFRPGWHLPMMPMGGFAWEPHDRLRFEVMAPRSRALAYLGPITLFVTAEWRNITYAIDEGRRAPNTVTFNDYLASAGILARLSDEVHISFEAGTFVERTLHADVVHNRKIAMGQADFIRIGLAGPF